LPCHTLRVAAVAQHPIGRGSEQYYAMQNARVLCKLARVLLCAMHSMVRSDTVFALFASMRIRSIWLRDDRISTRAARGATSVIHP
jgi:hypothetical protein